MFDDGTIDAAAIESRYGFVRADLRPAGSYKRRHRSAGMSRRTFIGFFGGAAVGAGLAFVGAFPTARRAKATDQTPSTLSAGCYGPNRTGQPLAGNTGCCSCGSNVSSTNCGSDNWHRHHPVTTSQSVTYFVLRLTSCKGKKADGTTAAGKNAWEWDLNGSIWRCSDGTKQICVMSQGCGSLILSVCPKELG